MSFVFEEEPPIPDRDPDLRVWLEIPDDLTDDDRRHALTQLRGFILTLDGALPIGRLHVSDVAGDVHEVDIDPTREPRDVEVPPDAFTAVETATCENCGQQISRVEGSQWLHVQPCAYAVPRESSEGDDAVSS